MSLSCFNFVITYWPCNQQGKIGVLSCRSYLAPKVDVIYDLQKNIILKLKCLAIHSLVSNPPKDSPSIEEVKKTLKEDLHVKKC